MKDLSSYQERREHPRYLGRLPFDYWETPDVVRAGLVADMSEVGLHIHCIHSMQIGALLNLRVYVSKEEYTFGSIEGKGKVIWRKLHCEGDWKGYLYGLYLTAMTLDDKERLKQLLTPEREDQDDSSKTHKP